MLKLNTQSIKLDKKKIKSRQKSHQIQKAADSFISGLFLFFLMCCVFVAGCAGPRPLNEILYADTALEAARNAGAPAITPGFYHSAEENYNLGKKALEGHYNLEAQKYFILAREYAEKAENATRLKKFKSGETF